ncbi:hypothetical protein TIFTF001_013837 [Ficus carica]|uniref:Uncharacterized protein n=1 Tax=Ficus carica TaxID=3494 RepID=A0AA88A519_FICCA|nr:hypothetical protein TIFTF001_013837 [Ficus carica]
MGGREKNLKRLKLEESWGFRAEFIAPSELLQEQRWGLLKEYRD